MASQMPPLIISSSLLILVLCTVPLGEAVPHKAKYSSIFSFGDSLADTGNFLLSGALPFTVVGELPYGETYFRRATGRCSDGRLIVDFIANAYGLPFLPPYLAKSKGADFTHGANFAVAGATALDPAFFQARNLSAALWTTSSLSVQLKWFKEHKASLCSKLKDCNHLFNNSLFLVGEIGGNDYNYAFLRGKTVQEVMPYVPNVVNAIASAASSLIEEGAVELVVPGNLPVGCSAAYLTIFYGLIDKASYDPRNGCLRPLNSFAMYHNNLLQSSLERLRQRYPHANIIYADYYGAAIRFFHTPKRFGFSGGVLRACCGGGGPYNFNYSARCGHAGSTACSRPSTYLNWDGIHLSEAGYRLIAQALIEGPFSSPPIKLPWQ